MWYDGRKSLGWFFDGWVNGTAVPRLQLSAVHIRRNRKAAVVSGTVLQYDAPADLVTSVPIYAVDGRGAPQFLGRVFADGRESRFRVAAPARAQKILLDPYHTVLSRAR
jgi:hypothetical protein